jgi:hypothetical protein
VEESWLTIQKVAYVHDRNPVTEHLLVMCKSFGLVSVREVDRLGASDVDNVGVQDLRKGCEAHLFERPVQLEEGFDLLVSHWIEVDRRLNCVDLGVDQTQGSIYTHVHSHV